MGLALVKMSVCLSVCHPYLLPQFKSRKAKNWQE